VLDVGAEECLQFEGDAKPEVSKLPVIDCTKPHTHEIFATVKDEVSDVFPGMSQLEEFATTECYGRFKDYVGIDPWDSALRITWIVPSLDSWNDKKDRTVLCIVERQDSGQLTTSVKNLKI
jgi:Septum formation